GEYFRRNIGGWRPLADLCLAAAPKSCAPCEHWRTNDGDGLDGAHASMLAKELQALMADGTIQEYIRKRDERLRNLPDETCSLCNGTGIRNDKLGEANGLDKRVIDEPGHPRHGQAGTCNACNSIGT